MTSTHKSIKIHIFLVIFYHRLFSQLIVGLFKSESYSFNNVGLALIDYRWDVLIL